MPEIVNFTKFNGGKIVSAIGEFESLTDGFIKIIYEEKSYSFKRIPGPKSGWGVGVAKSWRLDLIERKKYCFPDERTR